MIDRRLCTTIERIAPSDLPVVLVCGDRATRRRAAAMIHRRSARATRPFLVLDCAGAGAELEQAMLGRAEPKRDGMPGVLERACGGTVLLDRIEGVPARLQLALLRTLEESQVVRLGGHTARPIDVRIIVAASGEVELRRVRADLFYRLAGISIVL